MAADAIKGYIESLTSDGLPIPEDVPTISEPISVKAA